VRSLERGYFAELEKLEASGQRVDWGREIARAVLERNKEMIYQALAKKAGKGSSRAVMALLKRV